MTFAVRVNEVSLVFMNVTWKISLRYSESLSLFLLKKFLKKNFFGHLSDVRERNFIYSFFYSLCTKLCVIESHTKEIVTFYRSL